MAEHPIRIQRKRTKGWKMPENTVCVSRPSKWGNPYSIWRKRGRWLLGWHFTRDGSYETKEQAQREAARLYKRYFKAQRLRRFIGELRGKNVCCWCGLDDPCHGDFLLEISNG